MGRYDFLEKFGLKQKTHLQITGAQVDSRQILPGDLFFALKGEKFDGHQFLNEVKKKGAIAAVVSEKVNIDGLKLIYVEDVLSAMQEMAKQSLKDSKALVIAVTGSIGKTTTKEMIATLLESKYKVGRTFKNQNSQIGFPLSILNFQKDENVYVLEMGMTQKGHIEKLCDIGTPDAAIITKGALVHAENFQSLDEIVNAKAEIFLKDNTKIKVFDHALYEFPIIQKIGHGISFSLSDENANFYLDGQVIFEQKKKSCTFHSLFSENHFRHDFLGAVAICRSIGLSYEQILRKIPEIQIPKMRFEKIKIGDILFINDAYNASLDSMKAAIGHLPNPKRGGRKIGVLGTMAELGSFSEMCHAEVGRFALKHLDAVFCIGEQCHLIAEMFQNENKWGFFFDDLNLLSKQLKKFISADDVVLVKASRVMKLEKLFELI